MTQNIRKSAQKSANYLLALSHDRHHADGALWPGPAVRLLLRGVLGGRRALVPGLLRLVGELPLLLGVQAPGHPASVDVHSAPAGGKMTCWVNLGCIAKNNNVQCVLPILPDEWSHHVVALSDSY